MSKLSSTQIIEIVDRALAAKEELLARGETPGDVLVITGCAIGVMLSGGQR